MGTLSDYVFFFSLVYSSVKKTSNIITIMAACVREGVFVLLAVTARYYTPAHRSLTIVTHPPPALLPGFRGAYKVLDICFDFIEELLEAKAR